MNKVHTQISAFCTFRVLLCGLLSNPILLNLYHTGSAAEKLDRHWLAFEKDSSYLAASAFRFVDELSAEGLAALWDQLHSDDLPVEVNRQQRELVLREAPVPFTAKRRRQKRARQQKSP